MCIHAGNVLRMFTLKPDASSTDSPHLCWFYTSTAHLGFLSRVFVSLTSRENVSFVGLSLPSVRLASGGNSGHVGIWLASPLVHSRKSHAHVMVNRFCYTTCLELPRARFLCVTGILQPLEQVNWGSQKENLSPFRKPILYSKTKLGLLGNVCPFKNVLWTQSFYFSLSRIHNQAKIWKAYLFSAGDWPEVGWGALFFPDWLGVECVARTRRE